MRHIVVFISLMIFNLTVPAQETVVPIVHSITLLGGAQNGKWITAEKTAALLNDKTEFNIINFNGVEKGTVFGTKGERQGVCLEIPVIELPETESDNPDKDVRFALGANAKWNPVPRIPQAIGLTDKTYTKAVADFLKTKSIAKTKVVITQLYQIDLEGDGQNEVIIAGNYYQKGTSEEQSAGDYSFALLRKVIKEKPRNILIEGDFFTKRGEYAPPNEREILAIADLNGDGKMEIVLKTFYYEGSWQQVFEMNGDKLSKVLEVSCIV
ncbi:MAG: PliI family lysozyme inhibitor of I-type lysozyme [Pyrinomonadaceae bacterium]|nr:PliI family lysozyme inhibitor of I-type lysozyme [Pyrinomonadaceae bacterium]